MPSRRELLILGSAALGLPAATAQQLEMHRVEVQSDPDVDFAALKTYKWKDPIAPAANQTAHVSIIWYVERQLAERGLTKVPDDDPAPPDVYVRYYAKGKARIEGTPSKGAQLLPGGPETTTAMTSFDLDKVRSGTLFVEIQRASDSKPIWRAGSDFHVDEKRIDAEVSRAVGLLFSKYPTGKE
jgi:hypothetical protein